MSFVFAYHVSGSASSAPTNVRIADAAAAQSAGATTPGITTKPSLHHASYCASVRRRSGHDRSRQTQSGGARALAGAAGRGTVSARICACLQYSACSWPSALRLQRPTRRRPADESFGLLARRVGQSLESRARLRASGAARGS